MDPAQIHSSTESFSESDEYVLGDAYAQLAFRDSTFPIQEPSIILGRDKTMENLSTARSKLAPSHDPLIKQNEEENPAIGSANGNENPGLHEEEDSDADEDYITDDQVHQSEAGGIVRSHPNDPFVLRHPLTRELVLPIHPPNDRIHEISKYHMRVYWDQEVLAWRTQVLGRNGLFINDKFYGPESTRTLTSGDWIGVAGLDFRFEDPNDEDESDGEPEYGYDEAYESEQVLSSVEEDESDSQARRSVSILGEEDELSDEDEQDIDSGKEEEFARPKALKSGLKIKLSSKLKSKSSIKKSRDVQQPDKAKKSVEQPDKDGEPAPPARPRNPQEWQNLLQPGEELPKRRGPGRPPANGMMSKREMRERARAIKEGNANGVPSAKTESALSRKYDGTHFDGDAAGASQPKSRKRKRSDAGNEELSKKRTSGGGDAEDEDAKRSQTPKSPSPKREDYTEEQLKKPPGTYSTMVYDILKDCAPKALNLQELYKVIRKKHPFYKFEKNTHGWESSVRHTIVQNFFKKVAKDGKGWKVTINDSVAPPPQRTRAAPTSGPITYNHAPGATSQQPRPSTSFNPYTARPPPLSQHASGSQPQLANGHRPPIPQGLQRPGLPSAYQNSLYTNGVPSRVTMPASLQNNLRSPQPNGFAGFSRPPGLGGQQPIRPQASNQHGIARPPLQSGQQNSGQLSQQPPPKFQNQPYYPASIPAATKPQTSIRPGETQKPPSTAPNASNTPSNTQSAQQPSGLVPSTRPSGVTSPAPPQGLRANPPSPSQPTNPNNNSATKASAATNRSPSQNQNPNSASPGNLTTSKSQSQRPLNTKPNGNDTIPAATSNNDTASPINRNPTPSATTSKAPSQASQASQSSQPPQNQQLSGLELLRRGQTPKYFEDFRANFCPRGTPPGMIRRFDEAIVWLKRNGPDKEKPPTMGKYVAEIVDLCLEGLRAQERGGTGR